MIINRAHIIRFRGFEDVSFDLGSQLTVIAGQNGTQKTTILGILTQPFTITNSTNPMIDEKPLSGGNYKSGFAEKFRLSPHFDLPKTHEWTLYLKSNPEPFTVESIKRENKIRFWKKGDRSEGSGYIQLPVIFLSLKRLLPIGEDLKITTSKRIELSKDEVDFLKRYHNQILISLDVTTKTEYIESTNKNTIGVSTSFYDWNQNSAGQDNVGKILLAILSFKRLKDNYPKAYQGGILAIDEIDATLYPGSQYKLIEALRTFASKFQIQIIITTHSTSMLEQVCELQKSADSNISSKGQIKLLFLEKINNKIKIIHDPKITTIRNRLNVSISNRKEFKLSAYAEDKEAIFFTKCLLKTLSNKVKFVEISSFSNSLLIELAQKKVNSFTFPNSIIFLDGDVRNDHRVWKKVEALPNALALPTSFPVERLIAEYLDKLDDESPVWKNINEDFTKQYCFRDYKIDDIISRDNAKLWFNSHLPY